jgi:hypothetical protein
VIQQRDNRNRDKDNNHNNNDNEYKDNNDDDDNDDDADDDAKDNNKDGKNDGGVAAASGGWWQRGMATNAARVGAECLKFSIETGFWVLLVVGEGPGRLVGSSSQSIHPEKLTYIEIKSSSLAKKIS